MPIDWRPSRPTMSTMPWAGRRPSFSRWLSIFQTGLATYTRDGYALRLTTRSVYAADGDLQSTVENLWAETINNGTLVRDPLGEIFTVNDNDPSTIADNPHTTTYQYDAYGRTVKTIYADGSYVTQGYDAFGRKTSESYQTAAECHSALEAVRLRRFRPACERHVARSL